MADATIAPMDYLRKPGIDLDNSLLKEGTRFLTQQAVKLEAEQLIGADLYERSNDAGLMGVPLHRAWRFPALGVGPLSLIADPWLRPFSRHPLRPAAAPLFASVI